MIKIQGEHMKKSCLVAIGLSMLLGSCSVAFAAPVLKENTTVTRANTNAYMEVDLAAFKQNLKVAKQVAGKAKVCAVLKSDAYVAVRILIISPLYLP